MQVDRKGHSIYSFCKGKPPQTKGKDSISSCSRGAKRCRPTVSELSPLLVEDIQFGCIQRNGVDIACLPIWAVYMLGQSSSVRSSGFASNTDFVVEIYMPIIRMRFYTAYLYKTLIYIP